MEIQDILRELEREIIDNKCNHLWEYFKHNGNLFSKEQLIGIVCELGNLFTTTLENEQFQGNYEIVENSCRQLYNDIRIELGIDNNNMSVKELTREQLTQLKEQYYIENNSNVSYGELASINELVSETERFERYEHITFVAEDFLCNN